MKPVKKTIYRDQTNQRDQTTLSDQVTVSGIGVHSGKPVTLMIHPADADTGIRFLRTGLDGMPDHEIPADVRAVSATELATVLSDASGASVCTAEHVLSALRGMAVDNALIELDGREVPILDGSAEPFCAAIEQVGLVRQAAPRRFVKVLKPVRVARGAGFGELLPNERGFRLETEIEFDHPLIGRQAFALDIDPVNYRRHLSRARTFGFMRDVAKLWGAGYALGASFENTLVVTEDRILNPEGLRFPDEFVRHKALDAVGDLALAGAPLLATYRSFRGGHKINHAVLSALMADPSAWTLVEAPEPVRRSSRGHAEAAVQAAPVFGPDRS